MYIELNNFLLMDINYQSKEIYYLLQNKIAKITISEEKASTEFIQHNIQAASLDSQTILISHKQFFVNGSSESAHHNIHYSFDLNTFCSVELASMKYGRFSHQLVEYENLLIVTGGYNNKEYLSSCEAYEINSNQWSALPDLNEKRSNHISFVYNGNLYVFGGIKGDVKNPGSYVTSLERLSEDKKKWEIFNVKTDLDRFPVFSNSYLHYNMNNNNVILIFGDRDNQGERNSDVISLNPETLEITKTNLKLGNSNWFYRYIYFTDFQNRHNFISRNGHLHRFDSNGSNTWEYIREFVSIN
jgi:hypothetical protein